MDKWRKEDDVGESVGRERGACNVCVSLFQWIKCKMECAVCNEGDDDDNDDDDEDDE